LPTIKVRIERTFRAGVRPLARRLSDLGIHPHFLTLVGLLLSLAAATRFAQGHFGQAGWLLLVAGLADVLDGEMARASGKGSRFGAFLDSTLDRYSEIAIFLGLMLFYLPRGGVTIVAVFLALTGSILVSYAKARAEGLGGECKVGLLERPERVAMIVLGALLGEGAFPLLLWPLAVLTHLTAIQRVVYVFLSMRRDTVGMPGETGSGAAP
jgi:CDP-diacylglycerol--glycerol-3-phosphate 3-phosphatidyltransferase